MSYIHRQITRTGLLFLGLSLVALSVGMGFTPGPIGKVALAGMIVVLLVTGLIFSSLKVEIAGELLCVSFGPGWPRRAIPLASIREARVVRNRWWYGWGIRLTPSGWLWNVAGLDALELELEGGKRFRIGTDDPQGLLAALRRRSRVGKAARASS